MIVLFQKPCTVREYRIYSWDAITTAAPFTINTLFFRVGSGCSSYFAFDFFFDNSCRIMFSADLLLRTPPKHAVLALPIHDTLNTFAG